MKRLALRCMAAIAFLGIAASAMAHDCGTRGGPIGQYLRGHYHGGCARDSDWAHGYGVAEGADTYAGLFVNGRPEGKGLYTWASGATLEGIFKDGKAHGAGIYVSAKGVRHEGQYKNGKPEGWALSDCPTTPGPLAC